ncbi:MAG: sensor histidine kinase [Rhodospirillales bacterium]|nr:sensor histidine kinase [Rhodospirillales bacterium]
MAEASSMPARQRIAFLGMLRRLTAWANRVGLERKLSIGLLFASAAAGIATYGALTDRFVVGPGSKLLILLLYVDLILLVLLGAVVVRRLAVLWAERRRGLAGSRLHGQLVLLFSVVAVTPTIIVAIFSLLFFNLGVDAWFSDRIKTVVDESLSVAEAYLQEHQHNVTADVLAMGQDISQSAPSLMENPTRLNQILAAQTALRGLTEAIIFDGHGNLLARSGFSFSMEFDADLPKWALERARNGEVVVLSSDTDDRVRALVQLDSLFDVFLYVGRSVDPRVLSHLDRTQGAVKLYGALAQQRSEIQVIFVVIFAVVAVLLLLAAVWVGIAIAARLVKPIGQLIRVADRVGSGELDVRVSETDTGNELASLSRAFNRMTEQLAQQQHELRAANAQLDGRRRFTEAVLSGVSAGVIGLDADGAINLPNRSASELLGSDLERFIGISLEEAVPEMGPLLESARRRPGRMTEAQINLVRDGQTRQLLVRVVQEMGEHGPIGFVVTFDDITALLSAQRKAAWADVARRIAHEIKNPLTPIQLSAERLKRKYLKEIASDPETFRECTDTIVRQVGDIGRMVDEFSSFARMPSPVMREENLGEICHHAVVLQRAAHPMIDFLEILPPAPVRRSFDSRQIGQALTNILKNAAEAIEGRDSVGGRPLPKGRIAIELRVEAGGKAIIAVSDNGRGLPKQGRERLTEPYVTTRAKGTGLGLAIVKKIMEDHGGDLLLEDNDGGGARVRLIFAAPAQQVQVASSMESEQSVAHGT